MFNLSKFNKWKRTFWKNKIIMLNYGNNIQWELHRNSGYFGNHESYFYKYNVVMYLSHYTRIICAFLCIVAQQCLTLCNLLDCSQPVSSVHRIFPASIYQSSCHILLQGIFPTQGSNLCVLQFLHWQVDSLPLRHLGILLESLWKT